MLGNAEIEKQLFVNISMEAQSNVYIDADTDMLFRRMKATCTYNVKLPSSSYMYTGVHVHWCKVEYRHVHWNKQENRMRATYAM